MINTDLLECFKEESPVFVVVVRTSHNTKPGHVGVTAVVRKGKIVGMSPSTVEVYIGDGVVTRLPEDVFLTVEEALKGGEERKPWEGSSTWN